MAEERDKRAAERHAVAVPVEVLGGAGMGALGVSGDVSEAGIRLVIRRKPEVGQRLALALNFPDGTRRLVRGVVQRVGPAPDPHGFFPHQIAVAFDEPQTGLEALLSEVEALEAQLL